MSPESKNDLKGKVAVVTGASRGAGKGIAIALGAHGATVYVTGRSLKEGDAALPGTIAATADAVTKAGGKGIAVACDHARDADVKALFERVQAEQGRLDILVNNATFLHDRLIDKGGFWEKPLELVDILDVGLRSAYVASWYAAPLMVQQKNGLIAFTSSFGASCYTALPTARRRPASTSSPRTWASISRRTMSPRCRSGWACCAPTAPGA
jgi:NAD(P)-dependent dehydrogenase (short-subunit alcohol dehydrogenase family)